jgi:hypothetical protein
MYLICLLAEYKCWVAKEDQRQLDIPLVVSTDGSILRTVLDSPGFLKTLPEDTTAPPCDQQAAQKAESHSTSRHLGSRHVTTCTTGYVKRNCPPLPSSPSCSPSPDTQHSGRATNRPTPQSPSPIGVRRRSPVRPRHLSSGSISTSPPPREVHHHSRSDQPRRRHESICLSPVPDGRHDLPKRRRSPMEEGSRGYRHDDTYVRCVYLVRFPTSY